MATFYNINIAQQIYAQFIPSTVFSLKMYFHNVSDESFPLETRSTLELAAQKFTNISTLLNDVLSAAVVVSLELPNFLAVVIITFIFGKMYSKTSVFALSYKMLVTLKKLLLINIVSIIMFFSIRAFLFVLPSYYQTKYWLNPSIRAFFLNNDLV
jgi:hypothetical protein